MPAGSLELLGDLDRASGWVLMADGVPQSYVDLEDPRHLELEYMRRLGHLVDLAAPAGAALRVLHLGAGGLTLARYVAATRPGASQLAVDLDPEVFSLVRERLPLAERGIALRLGDARTVLGQLPPESFDIVVADVFAGARTPAHLTTLEFTEAAARVLTPAGLFVVNAGDGPPLLAHAPGRIATVQAVFPRTCVIAEAAVHQGRSFGNFVIAGAWRELPLAELASRAAADPYPADVLAGTALDEFVAGALMLTDAGAQDSPAPPPGEAD
jgi:spermidine synthase